jgi:hypothetical protein
LSLPARWPLYLGMSLFNSKQLFGRDCDEILKDKKADPFEKLDSK